MTNHRILIQINTIGANSGTVTAYSSETSERNPGFWRSSPSSDTSFLSSLVQFRGRVFQQTIGIPMAYIGDVLSLTNFRFDDYQHLIYPNELEVKYTTDTQKSASYHDLHLEINNGERLKIKQYEKLFQ